METKKLRYCKIPRVLATLAFVAATVQCSDELQANTTTNSGGIVVIEPLNTTYHTDRTTDQFCVPAGDPPAFEYSPYSTLCEDDEAEQQNITDQTSLPNYNEYRRNLQSAATASFSGECGPHCRPSCLTLALDLRKLPEYLVCDSERFCQCEFEPSVSCRKDGLYSNHPQCHLETAKCLGPTVYEDSVGVLEDFTNQTIDLPRCQVIPNSLHRFQGWPVASPIQTDCREQCFDDNILYFEYCNTMHEEYCDDCTTDSCGENCGKVVQPFSDGWTSFVVSTPIPSKTTCHDLEFACFAQRVDILFPSDCPTCHACPMLHLGDTFGGVLEIVGFGHGIQQPCTACNRPSVNRPTEFPLSCEDLLQCQQVVDCATNQSLGVPDFIDNNCSFHQEGIAGEDSIWYYEDDDASTNSPNEESYSTESPSLRPVYNQSQDQDQSNNGTSRPIGDFSAGKDDTIDPKPKNILPVVAPIAAICLALFIFVLFLFWKMHTNNTINKVSNKKKVTVAPEEIIFVDQAELDAIDSMLAASETDTAGGSRTDSVSLDLSSVASSEHDTKFVPRTVRVKSRSPLYKANSSAPGQMEKTVRNFQSASLMEQPGKDEVEALYITGQHIISGL